ncbi:hypothetical protein GCM10022297_13270 [Lactobacillus hamsteri]|uniref:Sortase n=1 Tax=Lactobacillus hamsteri DSM 5661 = JCM 6256 TaxID=1423754 RepID=A0A0R1Y7P2_9LACO|nr:DUF3990 domain-containing protein [Lactobacillus hamsteri]KRM38161.1 hypothetical protein FC39_GL001401 [Lactobacillus hamsteri DSM 5661 = JCM 6256]
MLLYHGSYTVVRNPKLLKFQTAHDFGDGFYLTSDKNQAREWAIKVVKRKVFEPYFKNAKPVINIYNIGKRSFNSLNVKKYSTPDINWLNFVTENRLLESIETKFDIICGPVADANPDNVLMEYSKKRINWNIAIKRLRVTKLTDQYAFKTERALELLSYEGEEIVEI